MGGSLKGVSLREEKKITHMMDNVVVCDIVEKKTALPPKEVSVDGCSRSTLEIPFIATVMG